MTGICFNIFGSFEIGPLSDEELRGMVYEEEIDPTTQIDIWARPENRDRYPLYAGAQTKTIDDKKRALLLQAGFKPSEADRPRQGRDLVVDQSEVSAITGLSKWEDLRITFVTDHLVEVRIRGKPAEERTFVGLGFGHLQSGRPTILWQLLKGLALPSGELPYDHALLGFDQRGLTEQWLSRIRRVLQERFGLRSDPIPWTKKGGYKGYRCTFELKVADELRDHLEREHRTD